MKREIQKGDYINPSYLRATQPNQEPHVERMLPYDHLKDIGIDIGMDESGTIWILDGHNRASAALLCGVAVKVNRVSKVTVEQMWELLEG